MSIRAARCIDNIRQTSIDASGCAEIVVDFTDHILEGDETNRVTAEGIDRKLVGLPDLTVHFDEGTARQR